jgi:hypothetical protein
MTRPWSSRDQKEKKTTLQLTTRSRRTTEKTRLKGCVPAKEHAQRNERSTERENTQPNPEQEEGNKNDQNHKTRAMENSDTRALEQKSDKHGTTEEYIPQTATACISATRDSKARETTTTRNRRVVDRAEDKRSHKRETLEKKNTERREIDEDRDLGFS